MREFLRLPNAITSATAQRRKRHAQRIRRVPQERMPRVTGEKGRAVEAVFNSQQRSDRQNHGRMVANTKMTKEQLMFLRMVEWNLEAQLRVVQF